jgi:hypothetical protein
LIIALYLSAIIAANLIAASFGPSASVLTSFAFIGATLTLRDRMHDRWSGKNLPLRMAALIATGGLLSYLINADAGRIALASCLAFAAAETVDGLLYHAMRRWSWLRRANGSNVGSAAVDSLVFPLVAFGGFLPLIVLGQFLAKTVGGALWAWALQPRRSVVTAFGLLLIAAPAHGQIVSVDVGALRTPFATEPVLETYIASPPISGVRAYSIISWTPLVSEDAHKPTVVTQIALPLYSGPRGWLSFDAGATWFPFLDYKPEPTVGGYLGVRLPAGLHAFGLVSAQPRSEWERSYVVGLARTLYFRR